jgi:hypothetical protein
VVDEIISQLAEERARAAAAAASLRRLREQASASDALLEHPVAVLEHIDFFIELFEQGAASLDGVAGGLPHGITRAQVDDINLLAGRSATAQRRQVQFRGKWINKPLPYEQVRALLNVISVTIHEQLDAFRELAGVAPELESMLPPHEQRPATRQTTTSDGNDDKEEREGRGFNRRALFTRLFKPDA